MSVQAYPYGKYRNSKGDAPIAHGAGEIKMLLLKSGAAFDPNDQTVADVVNGGVEFTLYTVTLRRSLTNYTLGVSGSYVIFTSDPVTFTSCTVGYQIVAAVIYYGPSGVDSTSYPLVWLDGGSFPNDLPKDTTGGDLVISPHPTDGWIKI